MPCLLSFEYDSSIAGDGRFRSVPLPEHMHLQCPPVRLGEFAVRTSSGSLPIYGSRRREPGDPPLSHPREVIKSVSVAEALWYALESWADHGCHVLRCTKRGGWTIHVESGSHDGKLWKINGATWEQVVKKAALELIPGYWTP